jgi:PleD family two-component response regulator
VLAKPIKQSRLYDALTGIKPPPASGAAEALDGPVGDLSGLRVLVAEDNPVNRQVLMRQASRLGVVVTAVENGQEALDELARGAYDAC